MEASAYDITIIHYLDDGYYVRFSNALTQVTSAQNTVSEVFGSVFNLSVQASYNPYNSAADDCKMTNYGCIDTNNLVAACPHSSNHLTTTALREELINDKSAGTATSVKVLWTGHVLTGNPASNSHINNHTIVNTTKHTTNPSTYENLTTAVVLRESIFTLLHETSHQLDAHDHYCYGVNSSTNKCSNPYCKVCYYSTSLPYCVMSYRITNITAATADSLYCEECQERILAHLVDHH
jgi:hypothetical protein